MPTDHRALRRMSSAGNRIPRPNTDDPASQPPLEPLLPLYGMNTIFTLCAAEDRDRETCRSLIPMLMKEAIRKHEQALREALAKENKGE